MRHARTLRRVVQKLRRRRASYTVTPRAARRQGRSREPPASKLAHTLRDSFGLPLSAARFYWFPEANLLRRPADVLAKQFPEEHAPISVSPSWQRYRRAAQRAPLSSCRSRNRRGGTASSVPNDLAAGVSRAASEEKRVVCRRA